MNTDFQLGVRPLLFFQNFFCGKNDVVNDVVSRTFVGAVSDAEKGQKEDWEVGRHAKNGDSADLEGRESCFVSYFLVDLLLHSIQ